MSIIQEIQNLHLKRVDVSKVENKGDHSLIYITGGFNGTGEWVVDVDSKDPEYLKTVIELVNECRGAEENKVRYQIPTLHGYHLITIGFDVQQFNQKLAIKNMDPIDIQKDNPTLLYYATV